jgi:protein-S-isoprenylcysteine O-methyltransferase Ste14
MADGWGGKWKASTLCPIEIDEESREMIDGIRLLIFILSAAAITFISRNALRKFRSHGFYRFFAWVSIVALILWNLPFWFHDPFSILQLCAWFFLFVSLYVLRQGVTALRTGKQTANRNDSELYEFEKTSRLVTSGIYHYIRHPLYASLAYLALGTFLKDVSWISAALFIVALCSLIATAKADERECIEYFGDQYREYQTRSKMFVPFVL